MRSPDVSVTAWSGSARSGEIASFIRTFRGGRTLSGMSEVSISMSETVWQDIVAYEPARSGGALAPAVRAQLGTAPARPQEKRHPPASRVATFTRQQVEQLEMWLTGVVARPGAPIGAGAALHAVRQGLRLAQ